MNFKNVLCLGMLVVSMHSFGQNAPVDVFESTLKVGALSTEEFYYGFRAGDQMVVNFEELKGKELKEFEIIEYPGSSKFMDYKTSRIKDKVITVQRTGIYLFRLVNNAVSGRICRFKLQRIPADEAGRTFNCTVNWKTKVDTTFFTEQEKYLASRDTIIENFIPLKVERVHSTTATNGQPNKTAIAITLPPGTVAWSYYLGVGKDAEECFRKAEEKAVQTRSTLKAASSLASGLAKIDPSGSAAMAALALKGIAYFGVPSLADNIQYWFATDYQNAQLFMAGAQFYQYEKGNGPLCYRNMNAPLQGTFYLCLLNDNLMDGIDVYIRMTAVTVMEQWAVRPVRKYTLASREEPIIGE
jgi:hypothetical protein